MTRRCELVLAIATLAGCSGSVTGPPKRVCSPACPSGLTCTAGHCGPIACGSTTACPSGLSCLAGFCASQSCAPGCATGQVCVDQVCVAAGAVDAGPLACAPPYQLCGSSNGDGYCAATLSDSSNCGGCGSACGPGEVCNGAGTCAVACAAGEAVCADRCVSLATDRANCGVCGSACAAGQVCSAGACAATCASPEVACGASCADTSVDPGNCGGCGKACAAGQLCVAGSCTVGCGGELAACDGVCTDLQFDDANCGACAASCGASQICAHGQCDVCGAVGELCCSGGVCPVASICFDYVCVADRKPDAGFTDLSILAGQVGGPGNLNGSGPAARLDYPSGLACDDGGNLYVADANNQEIRQIALATGAVTTLAGSPGGGTADGIGAAAAFSLPTGVAYDGAGNLYVADRISGTIRQIVLATQTVTTIAGLAGEQGSTDGTGAAARFDEPFGLACDGAGNLYVADTGNDTIRQMDLATGAVTTLAGTAGQSGSADGTGAAARFYNPLALAYYSGSLYVADSTNATVRRIVIATGAVTTLAGVPGKTGGTDGIGAAALFAAPAGVSSDGSGNLYIADDGAVRRVLAATADVSTLFTGFGPMPAGISNQLQGVAYGSGNVYFADTLNAAVYALPGASGPPALLAGAPEAAGGTDGTGTSATFYTPQALACDGAGNLFVADFDGDTVRAIDAVSGAVTTLAGADGQAGSADGTGAAARFDQPSGLAEDDGGNLYVSDTGNDTIRVIDVATGATITLAGSPGDAGSADGIGAAARFNSPAGLAYGGQGTLYVADTFNEAIRAIALATGEVTTLAGTAGTAGSADGTGPQAHFNSPLGVASDGAGNLYVADANNCTIRAIAVATGAVTTLAGESPLFGSTDGVGANARFGNPSGLTYDGMGNLYVADTYNDTIRLVAIATGVVTTPAGVAGARGVAPGPLPARLNQPFGLALGPGPALFISDQIENVVLELQ